METKHLFEQLECKMIAFSEENLPVLRSTYIGGKAWHNGKEYTIVGIKGMAEIMVAVQMPLNQIGILKRSELSTIIPKDHAKPECKTCGGSGKIKESFNAVGGVQSTSGNCPDCKPRQ